MLRANRYASLYVCAVSLLILLGCNDGGKQRAHTKQELFRVPMVRLIANPSAFDRETLTTFGYPIRGEDFYALCPQKTAASFADCLNLSMKEADWDKFHARPVRVTGEFFADDGSGMSLYPGRMRVREIVLQLELRDKGQGPD